MLVGSSSVDVVGQSRRADGGSCASVGVNQNNKLVGGEGGAVGEQPCTSGVALPAGGRMPSSHVGRCLFRRICACRSYPARCQFSS